MDHDRKAESAAMILSSRERAFVTRQRIGHLATVNASGDVSDGHNVTRDTYAEPIAPIKPLAVKVPAPAPM